MGKVSKSTQRSTAAHFNAVRSSVRVASERVERARQAKAQGRGCTGKR